MIDPQQSQRNLYVLWIGNFLAACSFSLVMPFLPQFIEQLGVHENLYAWSGWTYAISFVASAIMSPIWGNLADRYGRKPMIIRSGICIGLVYLLMSMVTGPIQLFFLRMLNGALSGFIPSSIALIATNTPEDRVGRYLALFATGTAAGNIMGPMFGGTLAEFFGIRTSMLIGAVVLWAATALVWVAVKERVLGVGKAKTSPLQDIKLALTHRKLLALMVSAMLINASVQSLEPILTNFIPTLRQEVGLVWISHTIFGRADAHSFIAGFIFSLPAVAMLLAAPRWARVGEKIGFPKLLAMGLALAGVMVLPQSLVPTAGVLIILRFIYGIFTAAVQPSVNATLAATVHPSFRGRAYGINQSAMFVGNVVGPTLGGYVADWWGPRAVFVFTGGMLLVAASWVYRELASRSDGEALVGAPEVSA
ncbi:MAG TPA: MFS transporter [Symbiobacteriaceae bacterium]|nr:MFS transporter [Symbiobacteriaceae bacterium]